MEGVPYATCTIKNHFLRSNLLRVGAGAVEFIICHAEIQIAFVEEKKITEVGQLAQSFITSPTINVGVQFM
jgi:hypothetical protein